MSGNNGGQPRGKPYSEQDFQVLQAYGVKPEVLTSLAKQEGIFKHQYEADKILREYWTTPIRRKEFRSTINNLANNAAGLHAFMDLESDFNCLVDYLGGKGIIDAVEFRKMATERNWERLNICNLCNLEPDTCGAEAIRVRDRAPDMPPELGRKALACKGFMKKEAVIVKEGAGEALPKKEEGK